MTLVVEKRDAVGWVVFNQPAKKNAINNAMWRGIPSAMAEFDRDPAVRCVVFRGAGTEAFAAGADISEFESARSDKGAISEYDDLLDRVLHSIQDSLKPSVAMIHGFCLGGGLEIALACDLRYCGASAQFGIPAAKLGLAYNIEGHKRLLETVGHARAREIMFLGRRDFQIKHLGYRIELGEIEHAVVQVDGIRNCCAVYDQNRKEITLFYESDKELTPGFIREKLSPVLPKYMLPTVFNWMELMPRNPNGKIDRQKLVSSVN